MFRHAQRPSRGMAVGVMLAGILSGCGALPPAPVAGVSLGIQQARPANQVWQEQMVALIDKYDEARKAGDLQQASAYLGQIQTGLDAIDINQLGNEQRKAYAMARAWVKKAQQVFAPAPAAQATPPVPDSGLSPEDKSKAQTVISLWEQVKAADKAGDKVLALQMLKAMRANLEAIDTSRTTPEQLRSHQQLAAAIDQELQQRESTATAVQLAEKAVKETALASVAIFKQAEEALKQGDKGQAFTLLRQAKAKLAEIDLSGLAEKQIEAIQNFRRALACEIGQLL